MTKKVLGRGLSTLIPTRREDPVSEPAVAAPPAIPTELPVDRIVPNPFQPRRYFDEAALAELADSIRSEGIIQPIVVREHLDHYQLIAGERRWRAAKLAGLTAVPVRVQEMPDERMLEVALIENIQREDLDPIEAARAFQRLSADLSLSHEEIGRRTGKDRTTISNALRLLQLPDDVQRLLAERKLSPGHARALLKITDPGLIRQIAAQAVQQQWSVRYVEQLTTDQARPDPPERKPEPAPQDPNVRAAVEDLERALGTRVRIIERGKGRGRVEIDYFSVEDLDRIYSAIIRD
jgi:ParB family chromosome partitioning protein